MRLKWTGRLILLAALLGLVPALAQAQAVGTVTLESTVKHYGVRIYTFRWVAGADGAVSGHPLKVVPGRVVSVKAIPDTAAATKPDANYDLAIWDQDGFDVLYGQGTDLKVDAPNAPSMFLFHPTRFNDQRLDIRIAQAGAAGRAGRVILTIE
jgi:hypothetical protein